MVITDSSDVIYFKIITTKKLLITITIYYQKHTVYLLSFHQNGFDMYLDKKNRKCQGDSSHDLNKEFHWSFKNTIIEKKLFRGLSVNKHIVGFV